MHRRDLIFWGLYSAVALLIVGVLALNSWLWALVGVFALGVIPAFSVLMRSGQSRSTGRAQTYQATVRCRCRRARGTGSE